MDLTGPNWTRMDLNGPDLDTTWTSSLTILHTNVELHCVNRIEFAISGSSSDRLGAEILFCVQGLLVQLFTYCPNIQAFDCVAT